MSLIINNLDPSVSLSNYYIDGLLFCSSGSSEGALGAEALLVDIIAPVVM